MKEIDKLYITLEENERAIRMKTRLTNILEEELDTLKEQNNLLKGKLHTLAKENAKLKMDLERVVLRGGI